MGPRSGCKTKVSPSFRTVTGSIREIRCNRPSSFPSFRARVIKISQILGEKVATALPISESDRKSTMIEDLPIGKMI